MSSHQSFQKSLDCPTHESLLAFLRAELNSLSAAEENRLTAHLTACEFCELTLELLRAHPEQPLPAVPPAPPVPEPLRHLFPKPCHK